AGAVIDVPMPSGSDHIEILAVAGGAMTVRPGDGDRPVLKFSVVNHGAAADTVRQMAFTNLTEGPDHAVPAQFDAEWEPLTLIGWNRANPGLTADLGQPEVAFLNGRAEFHDLEWVLAPGDTFDVSVSASPTLSARDSAVLRAGIAAPADCLVRQPVHLSGLTPLRSGHDLVVDGFVSAQLGLQDVPTSLMAVGSRHNVVLDMILPGNGFLADYLYGLSLANHGTAVAGEDIVRMEVWSDGGNGTFETTDNLLGELVHSGDRWQLTGIHELVPQTGRRVFVTADIAETVQQPHSIRLGLPLEYGPAVVMDSGNDGPVDRPLGYKYARTISITDRVIVTADPIAPAQVHPGDRGVLLLSAVVTNTYAVDQTIESMRITNGTRGTVAATTAELDSVIQQVVLRYDGDNDGVLDDSLEVDPALGSGAFVNGEVIFSGLDIPLRANTSMRGFVVGDVSLTAAAEGDRPGLYLAGPDDFGIPGATTVATWPLDSEADLVVDGLVAAQVATGPVPVRALAPSDTLALAFDLTVPPNGYKNDELVGITLVNGGSAAHDDLARVRLWEDGGDGVFNPWSGDDLALGEMTWFGESWSSPVLGRPVGATGLRVFASVDVAAAPTDSTTVRLALPLGGLILDSQNSGPLDTEIQSAATLVLTTSPLQSTVVFDSDATNVGHTGVIRLSVHNAGNEPLSDIIPDLQGVTGTAGLSVGTAQPATLDLAVDASGEFTWNFTATAPGEAFVTASAEGSGSMQTFHSAPSPSPAHRVYDPALQLDCYPVTSLPSSVNKGQTGLVPITLTLANPGGDTTADVVFTGLRLRLTDHPGGAGIVPDDLVDAITVVEGTNIYAQLTTLPTSGPDIDLVFTEPAVITHREPVTLGVRLDLNLNTTATSFVVSLEDASFLTAVDAVSDDPVTVLLAEGSFPLRTGEAQLAAPAGNLGVAMAAGPDHAASPGQDDVPLASIGVTNAAGDASSSAINVSTLAFVLRDATGTALAQPLGVLGEVTVRSAYQQHYDGLCTVQADSILLVEFTTPAVIPADATVALDILADLRADAVPQVLVPVLADPDFVTGRDANTGEPVSVDASASVPGPRLDILSPPAEAIAGGRGLLPPNVAAGSDGLGLLELTLEHPGSGTTAPIDVDGLTLLLRDGAGLPLDPAVVFDRLRLTAGANVHADLVDPTGAEGLIFAPLSGLTLAPGTTTTLLCAADLDAAFDSGTFQLVLSLDGIYLSDAVAGTSVAVTPAAGVWPLSSGITRTLVPAEELAVGGANLMPPLLAPGNEAYPVLSLTVRNTASAGGGSIELRSLVVDQPAPGVGDLALGEAAATLQVLRDGEIVGSVTGLTGEATSATVPITPALQIPADADVQLQIALVVAAAAPPGSVRILVDENGLVAGHPGGSTGGIRIVPASGQALPLMSLAGTIGKAGLADSYVNFPNPFAAGREATTFAYALDGDATVTLRVLTPHGEPVITVLDRELRGSGFHQNDTWSGINGNGVTVRNGVYIAEITVEYDDGSRERHLRKVAVVR
ncbi:MAG: hypothetical protein GY838_07450, partial [bacterium]|nr:hypothetical protein [bacterium]